MSDGECVNEYYSDYVSDDDRYSQLCNVPTPGRLSTPSLASQPCNLRSSEETLLFMPLSQWDANRIQYDKQRYLHYELEWKFTFNKRQVAKQTEQGLVLAPGDFWEASLSPRLDKLIEKQRQHKPCEADATTIVMSLNERSERSVTKQFDETQVDWLVVERQLQAWSHLLRNGRILMIKVIFNYVDSKTAGPAGQGSTAGQLAERQMRRGAEVAVLGRTAAWELVFSIFTCPGAPCDRGPYCWQDPITKKHHKLMGHQLRSLVQKVQQGQAINNHEDMPYDIREQLHAEEHQHSSRKRKRGNSDFFPADGPAIHIHHIMPGRSDTSSISSNARTTPETESLCSESLEALGLLDDVTERYFAWLGSRFKRLALKDEYERACELALGKGLDLELIHEDQDGVYQFLIDHGIMEGPARHVVRDTEIFLKRNKTP